MDWRRDGPDWPHHERSRFVDAAGQRWHLQHWPAPWPGAPAWLLIHGTGASTHSFRDLAPRLATQAAVTAVDLPGHGFSGAARAGGATLPGMARGLQALLAQLGTAPDLLLGHSAGAAIAVRLALDGLPGLRAIVSLNGALLPLAGLAGQFFSPIAKLLAINPLVPRFFAWRAGDPAALRRLIDSTGSRIGADGEALYRRLVSDPDHVAGALVMMAHWDLAALQAELPRLATALHLVVGEADATVPPADAARVRRLLPRATPSTLHRLPGLGHLAHEERPAEVAALLLSLVDANGAATAAP